MVTMIVLAREGEVGAGDEVRVINRDPNGVPVSEITRFSVGWQRALRVAALPQRWKEYFRRRLEQIPTLN
jgi:hypothetical protein